ncbi:MAG: Phytochrome-like protein cph1 [Bacteroidota bacterium]
MILQNHLLQAFVLTPSPCLLLRTDEPAFTIAEASEAYLTATKCTRQQLINKPIFELFPDHPSRNQAIITEMENSFLSVIKNAKLHKLPIQEYEIPIKDSNQQEKIYWEAENAPILDEDGKVAYILHTVKSINEKTVADLSNQYSHEKYKAILENSITGFLLSTPEGKILEANKAACQILGYSEKELRKISRSLLLKGGEKSVASNISERKEKGWTKGEVTAIKKDGTEFTLEFYSSIFKDINGEERTCTSIADISNRKKNEQEISLLINNTEEAFVLLDKHLNILSFNIPIKNWYKQYFDIDIKKSDHLPGYTAAAKIMQVQLLSDALLGHHAEVEIALPASNQQLKNFSIRFHPAKNDEGSTIGVFITAVDITEKKQQQQQVTELLNEAVHHSQMISSILESISDGFTVLSKDWQYTYINDKGAQLLNNSTTDKLIGKNLLELFPDVINNPFYDACQRVMDAHAPEVLQNYYEPWDKYFESRIYPSTDGGVSIFFTDISEQKKTDQEIARQRQLLQQAESISHVGSWEIDLNNNKVYWSDEYCRMHGIEPGVVKPELAKSLAMVHPQDREKVTEAYEVAIISGGSYSFEKRIIREDKSVRDIISQGYIEKNQDGKSTRLVGVLKDITEDKLQQEEILRIKSNYESLINNINDLIWSIDEHYCLITANNAFLNSIKLSTGKVPLPGENILNKEYGPEINNRWKKYYQRALSGEAFNTKEEVHIPGMTKKSYVAISINPMYNQHGEITGVACFAKDITEDTLNLLQLHQTKENLKQIMDSSLDVICTITADGHFASLSAAAKKIWGYEPQEMLGKSHLNYIYIDQIASSMQIMMDVKAGMETNNFQNLYVRKDGSLVPMMWSARWDEEVQLVYCIGRDATEKLRTERALIESEKKYKHLFENNPSPMLIFDFETLQIIDCNEEALKKYEYSREEFLQLNLKDIRPKEDISMMVPMLKKLDSTGQVYKSSLRHCKKSGEVMFVDVNGHIIDYNGRKVVLVLVMDVTSKVHAVEELKHSEEKYKLLFYNSPLPMWVYDLENFKIQDVNQSATNHYGYSREEFLNMTISEIRPAEEIPNLLKIRNSIKSREGVLHFGTVTHQKKDKTLIKVEVSGHKFNYQEGESMMVVCNDVTEREKALATVKDHEKKLLTAQKIAKLGYWQTHLNDLSIYWSDEVYEIWGVSRNDFLLSAETLVSTMHPDDRHHFILAQNNNFNNLQVPEFEHRIILPDGSLKWIHVKGKLIKNNEGIPIVIEGTVQDITAEKLLELSLEESNQRYNYVTQATSDAIWDWDLKTNSIYWGEGIQKIFGHNFSALVSDINSWKENLHPDDKERVLSNIQAFINSSAHNWMDEYRFKKADGSYAHVADKGFIIRDEQGKGYRMVGAMQDNTQKKKEEQHLKLLESVITNSNDSILITEAEPFDEPGPKIVYVNEAFTKMTGYTPEEVVGKTPRILQGPKTSKDELRRLKKAMKNWEDCDITVINYKKNGEEFWIDFSVKPIADETGWFTHWIAVERDVTQKKNEELQKAVVAEISSLFNKPQPLNDILQQVLERMLIYSDLDLAEIWLIGNEKNRLTIAAKAGISNKAQAFLDSTPPLKSHAKGNGLPGITWQNGTAQKWIKNAPHQLFTRHKEAIENGIESIYSFPLFYKDEVIGVLMAGQTETGANFNNFSKLLKTFSTHLSTEIKRKQLEQELHYIFSFAPDVICIIGTDGYFKKINPSASQLLEYTEDELQETPFINFVFSEDKERTQHNFETLCSLDHEHYFENRFVTKSGKTKWLAWTCTPAQEEGILFAVAKDITDKKSLEERLDKANQLARVGSWETDLVKGFVYWSAITREIHEASPDYVPDLARSINFYKEGENRDRILQRVKECIENGTPWDEELQLITCKGNTIWIRTIGNAELVNGKCVRIYGSLQDINTRKRAEMEVLKVYEEKNNILESIGDAFFALDKNWVVTYWNKEAELLLKTPRDMIMGNKLWDVFSASTDSVSYHKYHEALEKNQVIHFEDFYPVLEKWYEIGAFPSENGLSVYFKDITERKVSDMRLKELNKSLQQYSKDLSISNKELEQFAYVASHDLQEPLRMVTGFLTQIEKKYGETIDEKGKQYIHFAVDGANRMRQIILDLLEFSRVGRKNGTLEDIALDELINEITMLHRNQIKETGAVIETSGLPILKTYRAPVRQIFQNLISNSLKYHSPNTAAFIYIDAQDKNDHWQFSVKDNGIGIAPQYYDKIFIIFQRLHTRQEYTGTGIGLAVTKKIIENMGGRIWVESAEGNGSTFYFTLPKISKTLD